MGAAWHTRAQNRAFLDDINESALRYVELTVASADKLLENLTREGSADCSPAALQSVRLRVYEHSVIKDVRLASWDGAVRCSAYAETLEFDRDWPSRPAMLAADGDHLRLFRVQQFTSDALGVFRDIGPENALVAIVGIDPMQLDVLPSALRTHGQVALELANGETVAASAPAPPRDAGDVTTVARPSAKFPMRAVIQIETNALDGWNPPSTLGVLAGAGSLGTLFGLLMARLVGRPINAAQALDDAIDRREFRPYYQPIFSLQDRRILGCEMLMRWVLPDGRVLPPSTFIPLAESTGRIDDMTWQVLAVALDELRDVLTSCPGFKMSFNAVPRHVLTDDFPRTLCRLVSAAGVSPRQIVIELTERDELEDRIRAQAMVRSLRQSGFRLALDDVGVGHSGLSHIQSLRPDTLKLDKFFVDALGLDKSANVVIDMLVRLARELGMGVVAEGIETEAQIAMLRDCGVGEGQGYLVAPPLPLQGLLRLIGTETQRNRLLAA